MMKKHAWDVSVTEATRIQKELQSAVRLTPLAREPKYIAGADISFTRYSDVFSACIVVLSYPSLEEVERSFVTMRVKFPYVPGYLSFREVPALAEAYTVLKRKPDLVMMDGHGIAHPRRLGVATHLGLVLDVPTIGCAKSRLYGEVKEPGARAGSQTPIIDPKTGDTLGAYLRTKERCKPVFVSPGHGVSLEDALRIAKACVRGYRIPEPTRRAHLLVNAFRRGEIEA